MADIPSSLIASLAALGPALLLAAGAYLVSEVLLWLLVHVIKPLTAHTQTELDDFVIDALPVPVRVGGLAAALWLLASTVWPQSQPLGRDWSFSLGTLAIAWAGFAAARIANALVLWYYTELSPKLKDKHGGEALHLSEDVFPMARRVVVYVVYLATLIVLLRRYDVEITPLLTGLGIAGLAVAMALQDSLSNFFSGVSLLANKPIKIGDFIALDSEKGEIKGFVEEVGWRTTRIRTRGNYTYYIPNNKLAGSLVVNFSRGIEDNWKGSSLKVGVDYSADPAKVKEAITAAITDLQNRDARLAPVPPLVRLEEFGDFALVFKVMWRVRNFAESEDVAGEVREGILKAFRARKIGIPYPVRTLRWEDGPQAKLIRKK
ncbi:MAG: mechanosensitive ion channel family protein [Candidatus Micrarchaeota archaeon]|nr:mechanosensitive ion channel family protein [Candidatus Micrarchaeota archaeon]